MVENSENETEKSKPWYKEGLRFACTSCGKCCTGYPGYVWVSEEEIEAMATFLQLPLPEFAKRYLRKAQGSFSLVELKSRNHACIFLQDNKCRVYGARPTQCRTFPFWPENLSSLEQWDSLKSSCEGINEEAPLVPYEKIEEIKLIQINSLKK